MVPASPRHRRNVRGVLPLVLATIAAATAHLAGQGPLVPGANVNMVRGTAFLGGDPFLQRQNEPSLAISTRNPCHLLAGANDYRTVDFPDPTPIPNEGAAPAAPVQNPRDAWLGVYTSMDCGATWRSALLPGHPFDTSAVGLASPNRGFTSAADPVVRAATNGLFFYAGLVFDRADNSRSQIFVSRFTDNNNRERGETIEYLDTSVVDLGDPEIFVDKPWIAVDQPRVGAQMCDIKGRQFPAGRVYAAWARFEGGGSRIMLSRSLDCGRTWQSQALTDTAVTNQGASIAIAPHDGTVYVAWRQFAREGSPATIQIATSRDAGATFTRATVASPINAFDQAKLENRRFRTNSLPTVAADHLGRVYVAWAERGYARASGRTNPQTGDARIVMAVSSNGTTFAPRYPIDDTVLDADGAARFGHQVMPSLTFAAGKLQIIYYDFSDDFAAVFNEFVDEAETPPVDPTNPNIRRRHTVDVRAAHAEPAALPVFVPVIVTPQGTSPRLSNYRTIVDDDGTVRQVQFNPPNLPLFVGGTIPFIGDYVDVAGLSFVPFQGAWRHNNSNTSGPRFDGVFPALPAYHAVWTDHRDVKPPLDGDWTLYKAPGDPFWKMPGSECVPDRAGMRNANIYTARVTNGLYAGSPGNTKPLGFQRTVTGELVRDAAGNSIHMQRSFVVFVQNSLQVPKKYLMRIVNQPGAAAGDRASFLRAPAPPFSAADLATRPYIWLVANVAPLSTISRTVFVTSANERAMVRVDVLEVAPTVLQSIGTDPRTAPAPIVNGRRATVLLNPDPTNPTIIDPDFVTPDVPVLAEETHDPEIFDPVVTTIGNVRNNAIELRNPDEANPDEANPDEANIDEETPDEANPDEANPDEANPDEANPDEANPDEANAGLRNTALSDEQLTSAHVVDVQWKVRNNGNTTTSFRFSPTFSGERTGKHFQLLVTKRYYLPAVDGITCELGVRRTNQVMVNVPAFDPRNPDEANPDEANPDEANPDEANPDEANPDEANPDEANATFFLAPGETATATLRVYDLTTAAEPPPAVLATFEETAAAVIQSQAVNTGEAAPPRDVAGADLVAADAAVSPANAAPGTNAQISWTLANRGTEPTEAASFRTRVLFSTDREISEGDTELAIVTFNGTVPPDDPATPAVNEGELPQTTTVTIPEGGTTGSRFILLVTDSLNEVPEADEANNAAAAELVGAQALAFAGQPSNVTQGFRFSTPVTVVVVPLAGVPPTVGSVRLAIASGPSGATLSGTLLAPVVAGIATFTDVTLSTPGTYTLVATGLGLEGEPVFAAPAVSSPFIVFVDAPPVAVPDTYAVAAGGILNISSESESRVTANDTDALRTGPGLAPPGRALLASLVQSAQHGTLTFNAGGGFVYQPAEGFDGVDFFTYRLNDGVVFGNTTTVRIAVGTGEGNAAPVTRPLSITVAEDSSNTPVDVVAAAIDADGDAMSIVGASAVNGTAVLSGGVLRYTPDPNYSGPDTIDYVITDGRGGNTPGVVSVTVTPVNDNPIARDDGPFPVTPSSTTPSVFEVLDNDEDGPDGPEDLTIVGVGGASHGAVSFSATVVRYTPQRGYTGPDSFGYEISDGHGGRAVALVRVSVGEANHTPVALNDAATIAEDTPADIDVLANDSDPDSDDISVESFTQGAHGTVSSGPGGTLRYQPAANFHGSDTFTYTITDGNEPDLARVTVTVTAVNDDPSSLGALPNQIVEEGAPDTVIDLTQYFTDVDIATDGDSITFDIAHNTNLSVVTPTVNGTTLTLDYNGRGTSDVGVRATDSQGASYTDAFFVTVGSGNAAPTANPDNASTTSGTPVTINVLANDTDPDRDTGGARVVASIPFNPPGMLGNNTSFVGPLAAAPTAPYLYLAGGAGVSVINTTTNQLVMLIDTPGLLGANRRAVDPNGLVYYSTTSNAVFAIDARPESPTFNQVVLSTTIAGSRINDLVLDSARGRLYVVSETFTQMGATSTVANSRVVVIDANLTSATYGSTVRVVPLNNTTGATLAVNAANGDVLVGTTGNNSGVHWLDDETFVLTPITGVLPVLELVIDTNAGRAYGLSSGGRLLAFDLATRTLIANSQFTVPGLASPNTVQILRHMVVDPDTGRVYLRSNGAAGAAGLVYVLQPGGPATFWAVLAQIAVGRDSGSDDLVIDTVADRIITGSGVDHRVDFINTTTNALDTVGQTRRAPFDLELVVSAGTRRVYADVIGAVAPFTVSPVASMIEVAVGGETGNIVVNPIAHRAYVGVTDTQSRIFALNRDGFVGEATGGAFNNAGRYVFAMRGALRNEVYVLNANANSTGSTDSLPGFVAVVDAAGTIVATHDAGNGPFGGTVNQTTGRLHIPAAGRAGQPGGITMIDPATSSSAQVNTSALFTTIINRNIAIVEALGKVYIQPAVVDTNGSSLGVYTEAGLVATRLPASLGATNINLLAVNQTTRRLYVGRLSAEGVNRILVIDANDDSLVTTLTIGSPSTTITSQAYVAVDEPRGRIYIADFNRDVVHVVDAVTHDLLRTLNVGDGPTSIAVNRLSNRVYVGSTLDSRLTFIDGATMTVRGALDLPLAPTFLDVDPAENRIYAAAGRSTLAAGSGVMVIADDSAFFTHPLTVASVSGGVNGTAVVNVDNTITFTPSPGAGFNGQFSYTVSDGQLESAPALVSIFIRTPLSITTASLPNGAVDQAYNVTFETANAHGAVKWTANGVLPTGLTLSSAGVLSGTLVASGTFTFTVRAQDESTPPQIAVRVMTLSVGPPIVPNASLPNALVGQAYSATLTAGGTTGAVTWSLVGGTVPEGLTLEPSGLVSGAPTTAGFYSFTVRVDDESDQFATGTVSLFVDGAPFIHENPRQAVVQEFYSVPPYTSTRAPSILELLDGTLPSGLTIGATGSISGTPQETGRFPLTMRVTDARGRSDTGIVNLQVSAVDYSVGNDGVGLGSTQAFGPTRRLAQTMAASADGELTGLRMPNAFCAPGSTVSAIVRSVTAGNPAVPDETGPALAIATGDGTFSAIRFEPRVFFRAGERFAIIFESAGACEFRRVHTSANLHHRGELLEAAGGGPWQRIADAPNLALQTLIQPVGLRFLTQFHSGHTATPLPDGQILVAGTNAVAERFDPATGLSHRLAALMLARRAEHTATLLDSGHVLIAGGRFFENNENQFPRQAELFHDDAFHATGEMSTGREWHTATKLADGRVVIAGGWNGSSWVTSIEIYQPATGQFIPGGAMLTARSYHSATLLVCPAAQPACSYGGKVLFAGGSSNPSAEIYDPATATSTAVANAMLTFRDWQHTATRLDDGRVLFVGSFSTPGAEIFDPAAGTFAAVTGSEGMTIERHTATRLPDGTVLVAGGNGRDQFELDRRLQIVRFVPATNTFVGAGRLRTQRGDHTATVLDDGRVLFLGGFGHNGTSLAGRSAEFFAYDNAARIGFLTTSLPSGSPNTAYTSSAIQVGGGTPPYSLTIVSGALPPGLTLANGMIGGTVGAAAHGSYSFVVQATDSSPVPLTETMPYEIAIDAVAISTNSLPGATVNVPYAAQLEATGTAPFTWTITSGALPGGLAMNAAGAISGTATSTTGEPSFRVRVRDASAQVAFRWFFIDVTDPLAIPAATIRDPIAPEGFGWQLQAQGGGGSRTWTLESGALPHGLSLSAGGNINGNAWELGNFNFTARVQDSQGRATSSAFSLHVGTHDYQMYSSGETAPTVAVTPAQAIAQTFTVSASGTLYGLRADATCGLGQTITLEVQGLDASGHPSGTPQMSDDDVPVALSVTTAPRLPWELIALPGRKFYPIGVRLAVVVTTTGDCAVRLSGDHERSIAYRFDGAWVPVMSGETPRDLAMSTIVDPDTDLAFTNGIGGDGEATHIFCPVGADGCTYPEQILVTGLNRSLQLYDPATHKTTVTQDFWPDGQVSHTATRLADGRVLVAGGQVWPGPQVLASAYIFDPQTQTRVTVGSLNFARGEHRAVLLQSGRVLIVGGLGVPDASGSRTAVRQAELFDPATNSFSLVGSLQDGRWWHTLTLLQCPASAPACPWNGKVLVFGGYSNDWPVAKGELYNPSTNTFTIVPGEENRTRAEHAAVRLVDGRVMLIGGNGAGFASILQSTEFYDPGTNTLSDGPDMGLPRMGPSATLLGDGTVLVAGGRTDAFGGMTATVERYNPAGNTFTGAGSMGVVRSSHDAVLLSDARVAFAGGWFHLMQLSGSTIERFQPNNVFAIITTSLAEARIAEPYDGSIATAGGDHPFTMQVIDGALPTGLALQNNAGAITIHGIPTVVGLFEFTVRAAEGGGRIAYQRLSILVRESLNVGNSSPPDVVLGTPYDQQLTAFGGTGTAWTWAFEPGFGAMPPGITLTPDGRLVGTPTAAGSFSWMIRVTDNGTPQQSVVRRIRLSVSMVDREQLLVNPEFGLAHVSAANNLRVAQTIIAGRNGRLTSVRLRAYCTEGHLTLSVYDATQSAPYLPTTQLTVEGIGVSIPAPADWREVVFRDPLYMRAGEAYAIVVNSFNGACNVELGPGGAYTGGSLYVSSWTAPDSWNPYGGSPGDFAFATFVEPLEISAFGSPTVDGRHTADEWSNASRVNVVMRAGDGLPVPATILFQNDLENLYMSIVYERSTFDPYTATHVWFDGDNDKDSYEAGEDVVVFNSSPNGFAHFGDNHESHAVCAPFTCWEIDTDHGGTSDGRTRYSYAGDALTIELQHPISSGDRYDLGAILGETIGVRVEHLIWEPNDTQFAQFPQWHESPAPWTLAAPADTCVLAPAGLTSWWTGEVSGDIIPDVQGSNTGSVDGGPLALAPGRFGNAYSFNGLNAIHVPGGEDDTQLPHVNEGGEITLEAWINVPALPVASTNVIGKFSNTNHKQYSLSLLPTGAVSFELWQGPLGTLGLHAGAAGGSITIGSWHHIVGSYRRGRSVRVYVDGVMVAESTALSGTPSAGIAGFHIGGSHAGNNLTGLVDEPALYARELSPEQVRSVFANGKCRPPAQKYTLQVITVGHGTITSTDGRINCGGNCVEFYPAGSNVTLTAIPHAFGGVTFTGYTGGCPAGLCSLNADTIVVATFTTNYQPWANQQFLTTPEDTAIPITLTGGDPEGQPITFSIVSQPEHGTLSVLNGAQVTYTPDLGFAGTDFFQFDTFDGHFRSSPGLIFISMTPGNRSMFVRSYNTGAGNSEFGTAVVSTSDGGYVLGRVVRFISDQDIVLAKVTGTGALVWETRLQALGDQHLEEVIQTSDGGYALVGGTGDDPFVLFIAKLDSTGAIEWQKVMGADAGEDFLSSSIAEDGSGNIYVSSTVERNPDGDNDIWVAKLTFAGAFVWQKWLGVPVASQGEVDLAVVAGGPMIVGHSTQGLVNGLLFHLNADGQVLTSLRLATSSSIIQPRAVVPVPGGGYVVAGLAAGRPWAGRFNADHTLAWSRDLSETPGQARIDSASIRFDGVIVISGAVDTHVASPLRWTAAFDINGALVYQQRYDPANPFWNVSSLAQDGGLALVGTRSGAFGDETILIKTDPFGQSGCDYGTSTSFTSSAPGVVSTVLAGATTDAAATVVSSNLATRVVMTSNIVQICPVP